MLGLRSNRSGSNANFTISRRAGDNGDSESESWFGLVDRKIERVYGKKSHVISDSYFK
jgi:hypothetical protein